MHLLNDLTTSSYQAPEIKERPFILRRDILKDSIVEYGENEDGGDENTPGF